MRADYLAIVDAAYRVELAPTEWLRGLCEAARPSLDGGLALFAQSYEIHAGDSITLRVLSRTCYFARFADDAVGVTA